VSFRPLPLWLPPVPVAFFTFLRLHFIDSGYLVKRQNRKRCSSF
jgi:hypothetical protein